MNADEPMAIFERHRRATTAPEYLRLMGELNDLKGRIKLLRNPVGGFIDRSAIDALELELNRVRMLIDQHLRTFTLSASA